MGAKLHTNGRTLYTAEELQFLVDHYSRMTAVDMAHRIGRPVCSVRERIGRLRAEGRLLGKQYRPPKVGHANGVRTSSAIQAEHAAVADEVRLFLARQVQCGLMTAEAAIAMALRLRRHLDTKGSAKLINLPVLRIVEMLEAA